MAPRTRRHIMQQQQTAAIAKSTRSSLRRKEIEDCDDDDEDPPQIYVLDGLEYSNYQDFVAAKRKRNQQVLMKLGFGPGSSSNSNKRLKTTDRGPSPTATQRGIKSNKKKRPSDERKITGVCRKSSRISGDKAKLVALDMYVNDWHRDNTASIVTQEGGGGKNDKYINNNEEEALHDVFFNGRVNDGSDISLKDAIELNDPKWVHDDSEVKARSLLKELSTSSFLEDEKKRIPVRTNSPTSVMSSTSDTILSLERQIEELSIDKEEYVAKVTPDRIYSVAAHPSDSKLICCAGDKQGYVGLWDVDGYSNASSEAKNSNKNNNGVSLFRIHSRPICCLQWLNNEHMVTASYDGSVRRLNAETGTFEEIFATYDDTDTTYLEDLGFGLDLGYKYWIQNVTQDHRYKGSSNPCLFVSTSVGDVFHVDLRVAENQKITFHESVSQKKVNTVSLHPNGNTLATSGNDGVVRLFDIRKFRDSRGLSLAKSPKPLCTQRVGLSVSSAFFSPSGKSLLTTSFANRLDLTENAHLNTGGKTIKPTHSIRHNNQTGRWLTTFQATWHPELDIFCSGSMNKPRCMEIFDAEGRLLRRLMGESLTSVHSRTCFHPSTGKLVMVGGNSSGRVVAIR